MEQEVLYKVLAKTKQFLQSKECKEFCTKRSLDEEFLHLTQAGYINKFLAESTFKESTQEELALMHDSKLRYTSHLLFPCYNFTGLFCGFIGRATFDTPFKFHLPEHILFSKETYIHGFERVDENSKFCFVTENMFEWGRILTCGYPAVSLNGAYKSKFKLSILSNRFEKLIFVVDNDQAGFELKQFAKQYLEEIGANKPEFVHHNEKGLDEFFVKFGKQATTELITKYI